MVILNVCQHSLCHTYRVIKNGNVTDLKGYEHNVPIEKQYLICLALSAFDLAKLGLQPYVNNEL